MAKRRRREPVDRCLHLPDSDIAYAFRVALRLGQAVDLEDLDSPTGDAVVRDVGRKVGGGYFVEYRRVSEWGKEAWG